MCKIFLSFENEASKEEEEASLLKYFMVFTKSSLFLKDNKLSLYFLEKGLRLIKHRPSLHIQSCGKLSKILSFYKDYLSFLISRNTKDMDLKALVEINFIKQVITQNLDIIKRTNYKHIIHIEILDILFALSLDHLRSIEQTACDLMTLLKKYETSSQMDEILKNGRLQSIILLLLSSLEDKKQAFDFMESCDKKLHEKSGEYAFSIAYLYVQDSDYNIAEYMLSEYALKNTQQYCDSWLLLYAITDQQLQQLEKIRFLSEKDNTKYEQVLQQKEKLTKAFHPSYLCFGYFLSYHINTAEHLNKTLTLYQIKQHTFDADFAFRPLTKENIRKFIHFGFAS